MECRNYDNMFSRFHRIPEHDGQTDTQIDRQTNGQTELLYRADAR